MKSNTFDAWRDSSELYARMLMAGKGHDIEPKARLVYVKMRAIRRASLSMWCDLGLTIILAAVWWFADITVRTYAGWGAIAFAVWSAVSVAALAGGVWDASRTATDVMSRLTNEEP